MKKSSKKNIKTLSLDFTNIDILENTLNREKSKFKKLDFIINNAAYTGSNKLD